MSLTGVIIGSVLQLSLALFLFMLTVFTGAGLANGNTLSRFQMGILNLSAYALPALCLVSAGIVIYLYRSGGSVTAYWWYGMPVAVAAVYFWYALRLGNH